MRPLSLASLQMRHISFAYTCDLYFLVTMTINKGGHSDKLPFLPNSIHITAEDAFSVCYIFVLPFLDTEKLQVLNLKQ